MSQPKSLSGVTFGPSGGAQASASMSNVPSQADQSPPQQGSSPSTPTQTPNNGAPASLSGVTFAQEQNIPGQGGSGATTPDDGFDKDFMNLKLGELPSDVVNMVKGAMHGAASTVGGIARGAEMAGYGGTGDIADELEQHTSNTGAPGSTAEAAQSVGYGGETLAEFLTGEGGLDMATSKGLAATSKVMQVLEKSPKLLQALKVGAAALKSGTVQGAQTLARTGDLGQAVTSGAEMAGTAGILRGAGEVIGAGANYLGKGAKAAGDLADAAANAPDKNTLAENIQGQLQNAKEALHTNYESKIQDFEGRLKDANGAPTTIDPTQAPIASKAEEILQRPDPEDHPSVAELKDIRGEKLDTKVRQFLENTASGKAPLSDENVEDAEEANRQQNARPPLVDASGTAIPREPIEPEADDLPPHDAHSLIQWRQQVRALAAEYPAGDVNAKALNRLLYDNANHSSAFDDTFTQLAQQSNDPSVVQEYSALRNDYRNKIGKYSDPVIRNLMEGKVDDAAAAFVGTKSASGLPKSGKTDFNFENLHELLGEQGMNRFRDGVFTNMLKNSSDKNGLNPAQFLSNWNRVSDETKGKFFNLKDSKGAPWVNTQIQQLSQDAKTAGNVQKLVRAGILGIGGKVATVHPVAAGLTATLAFVLGHGGHGGVQVARELLDGVANNPTTWKVLRSIGEKEASGAAAKQGSRVLTGAKALVNHEQDSSQQPAQNPTMNAVQGALARNPKQGKPLTEPIPATSGSSDASTSPDDSVAMANKAVQNLPQEVQNAVSTVPVNIAKGETTTTDAAPQGSIASVTEGAGNNTVKINSPKDFAANNPTATMGHELTHVWQNNLPPSVQSKIPDDPKDSSAFDISDADKLRKQGKTLVDLPREKQASIVQAYVEDPKKNANLKPWIQDMQKQGLSTTMPTGPNDTKLNMTPRAPGKPDTSVAGAYPKRK